MGIDVSILKKLLMSPKQRSLLKKQKRYAFSIDNEFSDSSSDDAGGDTFKNVLKQYQESEVESSIDRKLLLGIVNRNNDLEKI